VKGSCSLLFSGAIGGFFIFPEFLEGRCYFIEFKGQTFV